MSILFAGPVYYIASYAYVTGSYFTISTLVWSVFKFTRGLGTVLVNHATQTGWVIAETTIGKIVGVHESRSTKGQAEYCQTILLTASNQHVRCYVTGSYFTSSKLILGCFFHVQR